MQILTTTVEPRARGAQDQCSKLNARCSPEDPPLAFNLSSSSDDRTAECEALARLRADASTARPHLIFCTPERLATASFVQQLQAWHAARPFAYIVVDEAHLVAEQAYSRKV